MTCCQVSPLRQVPCTGDHAVVVLFMEAFGLVGNLPAAINQLTQLSVLTLSDNPRLVGALPGLALKQLLLLTVTVSPCFVNPC